LKKIILFSLCCIVATSLNAQAIKCKEGKPCGDSCIPLSATCPPSKSNPAIIPPQKIIKEQTPVKKKVENNQYKVTASALNVRNSPHRGSKILGTLKRGEIVSVALPKESTQGWIKIKFRHTQGWVSSNYIRPLH
jgi:uncharacterized protein YgiM (DUF1202 family)